MQRIVDIVVSPQDSLEVSDTITSQTVVEETTSLDTTQEVADVTICPEEPISISETTSEDTVRSLDTQPVVQEFGKVVRKKKKATTVTQVESSQPVEQFEKPKPKEEKAKPRIEERPTQELKISRPVVLTQEINEVLADIRVEEFGPGEQPLKELATVGVMIRKGVTTDEVSLNYNKI